MGKYLKQPIRGSISKDTWKDQVTEVIELSKNLNLQRIELRLPYGLGLIRREIGGEKVEHVSAADFLVTPPILVYSYLLFTCVKEPGQQREQFLEIKLTKNTGAKIQKNPNIQYLRAGAKGRMLYLKIPVASVKKLEKLVNIIMQEANLLYYTVCEQVK